MSHYCKDFTKSTGPFILKIEYTDGKLEFLRYGSWRKGLNFSTLIQSQSAPTVQATAYMTELFFNQYSEWFQHPEWLDLIQDAEAN